MKLFLYALAFTNGSHRREAFLYFGRGAGWLLEQLRDLGPRHIHCVPGALHQAFVGKQTQKKSRGNSREHSGSRLRLHENVRLAAYAAIRSNFDSDVPGVFVMNGGPDDLAALPAFRTALRSYVPLVCIAQQNSRRGVAAGNVLAPFTKKTFSVDSLEQCEAVLCAAWDAARSEPAGPVRVEIHPALLMRWTLRRA